MGLVVRSINVWPKEVPAGKWESGCNLGLNRWEVDYCILITSLE